jgi:hypothetical protein
MAAARKWQEVEVVGLLAWLDFCIEYDLDFKKTVVEHLQNLSQNWEGDTELTVAAIQKKLQHLSEYNGTSVKSSEILKQGSDCISDLTLERAKAVEQAYLSYEKAGYHLAPDAGSPKSDAPQKTKSRKSKAIGGLSEQEQGKQKHKVGISMSKDENGSKKVLSSITQGQFWITNLTESRQ